MIDVVKQNDWTDIILGVITDSIPSGFSDITVKIKFDENIRPFPEPVPQFMFVIGGKKRVPIPPPIPEGQLDYELVDTGNREVVMCIGNLSTDTEFIYKISRDPLKTGQIPPAHVANEVIFQNTMAGTLWGSVKQLDYMTSMEGQIAYLEELLLALFTATSSSSREVTLIENLWPPKNNNFKVISTSPSSTNVKISPGGFFVRNPRKSGLVKILIVAPLMELYGRSIITITYPPNQRKQYAIVYIDIEGEISVFYGDVTNTAEEEPDDVDISSIRNLCEPLAKLYLDSVVADKVITEDRIEDLRSWVVGNI